MIRIVRVVEIRRHPILTCLLAVLVLEPIRSKLVNRHVV
jgi:hypothetical protein